MIPVGRALRVLVTRPEPGAGATARRLAAGGYEPLRLPLSRTGPLAHALPDDLAAEAVAATSANALRFADAALVARLREKPFFAVGGRTAAAARGAGFADVREAAGDAAALAAVLAGLFPAGPGRGATVAYLCGRVRRPDFEAVLERRGIVVAAVETYHTLPLTPSPERVASVLGGAPADAVLLYSVGGARGFAALRERPDAGPWLRAAAVFSLSPRIAAAVPRNLRSFAAAAANEDALFALLAEWARA